MCTSGFWHLCSRNPRLSKPLETLSRMAAWLSSGLACLGGACIGTYPIFVKTAPVLAARVHPLVFQSYKTLCTALLGALLLSARLLGGASPLFVFSPWAVCSAAAWIPVGLTTISSVPRIGVGAAMLVLAGSTSLISFAISVAFFHEPLKARVTPGGTVYYLAPVYLATTLGGMAGLVLLPRLFSTPKRGAPLLAEPLLAPPPPPAALSLSLVPPPADPRSTAGGQLLGYALSVCGGVFQSLQYALVSYAKTQPPPQGDLHAEAYDPLGSWTASFGLGALAVTAVFGVLLLLGGRWSGTPPPQLQMEVVFFPGMAAGVLYALGLLTSTLAVCIGGGGVVMAQKSASALLVSGAWGILWFREIEGRAALAWCAAAIVTMASIVLLGFEKGP